MQRFPAASVSVACIEVGGSGCETVLRPANGRVAVHTGATAPPGYTTLIAAPGLVREGRVVRASNLNWFDVDPAVELGLPQPAALLLNDADAAARGERWLRPGRPGLLYIGLGTGVGDAVVGPEGRGDRYGVVGHTRGYGNRQCTCGEKGCLETVIGGWALSTSPDVLELEHAAAALGDAAARAATAYGVSLVVLAGGIVRRHPQLLGHVVAHASGLTVERTAAPATMKSAASWGLLSSWLAE